MKHFFCTYLLWLLLPLCSFADIRLPRFVSDGMVLQRDKPIQIWGWADIDEQITIRFNNQEYKCVANSNGKWQTELKALSAGGPYHMLVQGKNLLEIRDIMLGDVWICSGQSNMELPMERVKYRYERIIAEDRYPQIRQFMVPDAYDFTHAHEDFEGGQWTDAGSVEGLMGFTAVGYFFAKAIFLKTGVPVGLVNAALGGSPAEAWISEDALQSFDGYYQELQKFKSDSLIKAIEASDYAIQKQWFEQLNAGDAGYSQNWLANAGPPAAWNQMQVPGYWPEAEKQTVNGVVWLRKTIEVPSAMIEATCKLELGRIIDADSVFINGKYAGHTTYQYPPRRYIILPGILKSGSNEIMIRVVNSSGRGGFVPDKRYELTGNGDTVSLAGSWYYKWGAIQGALPPATFIRWKPTGLYNAMIAPLQAFAIKGVLWYQGESNAGRPGNYDSLMQTLIISWRRQWKQGDFPFLSVQLTSFMEASDEPQESSWARLRWQQQKTTRLPQTWMAITYDVGEWNDIHPEDKQTVGNRLALLARRHVYGEHTLVASGPVVKQIQIKKGRILLLFNETGSGLVAKNGPTYRMIAVAGANQKFRWANVVQCGNKLIVSHPGVPDPKYVRYAWANNAEAANIFNQEGLPAAPFTNEDQQ